MRRVRRTLENPTPANQFSDEGLFARWLRRIAARVEYRNWSGQAKEAQARNANLKFRRVANPSFPDPCFVL